MWPDKKSTIESHSANKDFPRGQMNGFGTTWTLKKLKKWDGLKNNTADPWHFLEDSPPKVPVYLALAAHPNPQS